MAAPALGLLARGTMKLAPKLVKRLRQEFIDDMGGEDIIREITQEAKKNNLLTPKDKINKAIDYINKSDSPEVGRSRMKEMFEEIIDVDDLIGEEVGSLDKAFIRPKTKKAMGGMTDNTSLLTPPEREKAFAGLAVRLGIQKARPFYNRMKKLYDQVQKKNLSKTKKEAFKEVAEENDLRIDDVKVAENFIRTQETGAGKRKGMLSKIQANIDAVMTKPTPGQQTIAPVAKMSRAARQARMEGIGATAAITIPTTFATTKLIDYVSEDKDVPSSKADVQNIKGGSMDEAFSKVSKNPETYVFMEKDRPFFLYNNEKISFKLDTEDPDTDLDLVPRKNKNIGGKVGGKVISLLGKLGKKKDVENKTDFMNKEFLRELAEDPEFDDAINNLPENEFVSLMDEMGFDYDAGMGPLSGNVDMAMQLDPEDAAKNYMAFDGFDNLTKYLTDKNASDIRLFIRTLTDDPDFGEIDSRVVNMAEKILAEKTTLRTMKNEGGLTQSEQVRQAIRMNAEDADMPFKGELTEAEKDTLGIFPTQGQVMEFRNNERINRERQRRERIAEENRRRSEQEPEMFPRSLMSEGGELEEVVVREKRLASEAPGGSGTSGRGFGQAAAKGILSALNPLNTLKLLDGVASGDITPQEAATNLIPGKPLADAIKAKQKARIAEGQDIVGKGRIKNAVKGFFSRDDEEPKILGPRRAMGGMMYNKGSLVVPDEGMPVDTYPNIPPEEMDEAMASQLPDEQMEDSYIDFIMDQSISEEDQDYLAEKLEQDSRLSSILDSIIVTASEFSGSGEVEGPGSGVSDSIPARLSDGEFVITKKATDQIGADNLQRMMDDAERAYDGGYQRKAVGGYMYDQDSSEVSSPSSIDEEIKKAMIGANKIPSLA